MSLYCQHCCVEAHPLMLTGYCVDGVVCGRCRRRSGSLAIVVTEPDQTNQPPPSGTKREGEP